MNKLSAREIFSEKIKNITAGQILLEIFSAWIFVYICNLIFRSNSFKEFDFFKSVGIFPFVLEIILVFWAMFFVLPEKYTGIFTAGELFFCAVLGAFLNKDSGDFFFFGGLSIGVAICIFLVKTDRLSIHLPKISTAKMWICAVVAALLFTVFVGGICSLIYKNYWTSCYDFGIFSQMFHYMKQTGQPLTTCERDGLLSHFAVHFSPVFYLLLPIYVIFPSPCTLLVMQALVVSSAVVPMILICRKLKMTNLVCLCFGIMAVLFPAFAGGSFTYIHENCFLTPMILWLIYFETGNRNLPKFIFAVLVLLVKEDACVYVALISMYFAVAEIKKNRKNAISNCIIFAFTVVYFIVVTKIMSASGEGVMSWYYDNYMYDGKNSLFTVILACIKNPVYVIKQCFTKEKVLFLLQMLMPLGFLPVMTRKPHRLLLLIPFVLVNLMSNHEYQYDIGFQYCFGTGAILLYLSAVNFAELKNISGVSEKEKSEKVRLMRKILMCAVCSSVIIFTGLYSPRLDYIKSYKEGAPSRQIIEKALSYIPKNASVVSSTFILPNLYDRDTLYQLETTKQKGEYYVLDLRYATEEYSVSDYQNENYEQVFLEENVVAVFKSKK